MECAMLKNWHVHSISRIKLSRLMNGGYMVHRHNLYVSLSGQQKKNRASYWRCVNTHLPEQMNYKT